MEKHQQPWNMMKTKKSPNSRNIDFVGSIKVGSDFQLLTSKRYAM